MKCFFFFFCFVFGLKNSASKDASLQDRCENCVWRVRKWRAREKVFRLNCKVKKAAAVQDFHASGLFFFLFFFFLIFRGSVLSWTISGDFFERNRTISFKIHASLENVMYILCEVVAIISGGGGAASHVWYKLRAGKLECWWKKEKKNRCNASRSRDLILRDSNLKSGNPDIFAYLLADARSWSEKSQRGFSTPSGNACWRDDLQTNVRWHHIRHGRRETTAVLEVR